MTCPRCGSNEPERKDTMTKYEEIFKYALAIQDVIDAVETRCAAVDGPVTPTHKEITDKEIKAIYTNALKIKACC